ncbi:MAG: YigZ family protein [Bacteroidota bacterium]
MFDDSYNTITINSEGKYTEKGSKFLSFCFPVKSEIEVKEILANLRKEYFDARHHCYAYRLGWDKSAFRFNDDGEPSGTAGRPIYGQILSNDLTNVLIVVIRYFGGTKLGVSGLINAYKIATIEALHSNKIIEIAIKDLYHIEFNYDKMSDVMKILKQPGIELIETDFNTICNITLSVTKTMTVQAYDALTKVENTKVEYIKTI